MPDYSKETGVEELRRIVRVLDMCNESTNDPYTAEQLIKIVRACWASPLDVFPDNLTWEEADYAAEHGALPEGCNERLAKVL